MKEPLIFAGLSKKHTNFQFYKLCLLYIYIYIHIKIEYALLYSIFLLNSFTILLKLVVLSSFIKLVGYK